MNINLQKGFFRLWVVFSIIWVGGTFFLSAPTAYKDFCKLGDKKQFINVYNLALDDKADRLSDRRKSAYYELVRRGVIAKISFSESAVSADFQGVKREFPAGVEPDDIWLAYRTVIYRQKASELFRFVSLAISFPAALLLLGLITRWIISGFYDSRIES